MTGSATTMRAAPSGRRIVTGSVAPRFEPVRDAFLENFRRRGELGAACCVYHRGEKVVDLWGGIRDRVTGDPWEADTMCLVFSTTKGFAGLAMALARSRGLFDYDERVASYWPEFGQRGKGDVTVRQLLAHQAGLYALDERPTFELFADLDRLADVLARQEPAWEPGTRQGYHAITLGLYEAELLRRVDPQHRTLGRFFHDEIATPLGTDVYIRLPEEVPDSRLARLARPTRPWRLFLDNRPAFAFSAMDPRSPIRRALWGSEFPERTDRIYARDYEVPSGGGVASARGIARAYGEFAIGGPTLGLDGDTLRELMAPAQPPTEGTRDVCLKIDCAYSLGFTKPTDGDAFAPPGAFGAPGAGGSFGFADPEDGIGYGYVPNQMVMALSDPRDTALRTALYRVLGKPYPRNGM